MFLAGAIILMLVALAGGSELQVEFHGPKNGPPILLTYG